MKKPTIRSSWHGNKGNMWRAYDVTVEGKKYHHQSKTAALTQYNAALRMYKKMRRK